MNYDVFISHASEDKKSFVEPLANALVAAGIKVWYDRFEMKIGDSLREEIDHGLANCRYGVVVLSSSFFAKEWPKSELDALVARQNSGGKKVILPIWHEIGAEEVRKYSPILASKLAARSTDGIEAIVAQIIDICNEEYHSEASVFQVAGNKGLREECLEIIRNDDIIAWRKLIGQVSDPIPGQLKEWKKQGEEALNEGGKAWETAVYNAAQICLPGFVPIFAAVEAGNLKFWKESIGILRILAIHYNQMGGGLEIALRIGCSMLSVAGFLGLSIAASLKLFDFVNEWMCLLLPGGIQGDREISWLEFYLANRLPERVSSDEKDPFVFLTNLTKTDLLKNFFPNEDRTINNLFLGNLLSSLIEFRQCASDQQCRQILKERPQDVHTDVFPFWFLMKNGHFQTCTLDLFGDSQSVYQYVFPNKEVDIETFWGLWKQWRVACSKYWRSGSGLSFRLFQYKSLPGEPTE